MFYDVLWCFMIFYDVLWCSLMFCDILWCSVMFYYILWCFTMFYVLRAFLVSFFGAYPRSFSCHSFIGDNCVVSWRQKQENIKERWTKTMSNNKKEKIQWCLIATWLRQGVVYKKRRKKSRKEKKKIQNQLFWFSLSPLVYCIWCSMMLCDVLWCSMRF